MSSFLVRAMHVISVFGRILKVLNSHHTVVSAGLPITVNDSPQYSPILTRNSEKQPLLQKWRNQRYIHKLFRSRKIKLMFYCA